MQAFVSARYQYHWAPLTGCLTAQLAQIEAEFPSHIIGAVTGIAYQPPQDAELPAPLADGLRALGVAAKVSVVSLPNRWQRFRQRRRIRRELLADRAVTAYGVGVSAFGPAWGLIVGFDDERRAWRRDGPMTEQVSPWLAEVEFDAAAVQAVQIVITARRVGAADDGQVERVAQAAFAGALARARSDLRGRIEQLESAVELEPQRHAHEMQTLAANWGEAAAFWRAVPHFEYTPAAQQIAVTLSRCATLFPYPMGGQPNHPGVRTTAVHILQRAADALPPAH